MKNEFSYASLQKQIDEFIRIVLLNPKLKKLLNKVALPNKLEWYISAGAVNQTVWNYLTNREITYGIGDYDFTYWDEDLSEEAENRIYEDINNQFKNLNIRIDAKNEARVHLWFEQKFGFPIKQYPNLESAIASWPSTATCVGVRKSNSGYEVCAPYGLTDIFDMKLRLNSSCRISKKHLKEKYKKWMSKWTELEIVKPQTELKL